MKKAPASKQRRPHLKSRTGCDKCKQRKVKCDETKPVCQKCSNRGQACSYLNTWPSLLTPQRGPPTTQSMLAPENPTTALSTPILSSLFIAVPTSLPNPLPVAFTILDLELLHFWITKSCSTFVDFSACISLFQTTIVQLAFSHQYLMHEILSLSAIHLSLLQTSPGEAAKYKHASSIHLATSLRLFQSEISNLSTENCHACFAFSTMIFMHSWAAQDISRPSTLFFAPENFDASKEENTQWVKLHRGAYSILQSLWSVISNGPLEPLFAPWTSLDFNRMAILNEVEARELGELALAWKSPSSRLSPDQREILDGVLENLRKIFSMLEFNPEVSKLSVVMAWFAIISDDYLKMLKEKIPEAMLLVVFYCVPLKRLDHVWWVAGKGENLLRTVVAELGNRKEWKRWLRWPVEQIIGTPVRREDHINCTKSG